MTLLNPLPGWILGTGPLDGGFRLDLGLREFMLADEMLEKIVPTVTGVPAVVEIAGPPLEMLFTCQLLMAVPRQRLSDGRGKHTRCPSFSCRTQSALRLKILGSRHRSQVQVNGCTSSCTCFVQSDGFVNFLAE